MASLNCDSASLILLSDAKSAAMLTSAVFITCAVTGSGDSVKKTRTFPVTARADRRVGA